MNPASLLIGLAILIACIPWVVNPLLKEKKKRPQRELALPAAERDSHREGLLALRDLEFDHRTGKVNDLDYANLKANLLAQLAATLKAKEEAKNDLDEQIEEKIRIRRENRLKGMVCSHCGATLAPSDHFCSACGELVDQACPKCGSKIVATDRFCRACGTRVHIELGNTPTDSKIESSQ